MTYKPPNLLSDALPIPIHFRTRSQYQNHHTDLFPNSKFQTDIDNTEIQFNPNLWNSSKNADFHNKRRNAPDSSKTRYGHTHKSKIIIRTCWNLQILILRSFSQKSNLSQFFQLKDFEMKLFFPNQLQMYRNSILTMRTSHNTWSEATHDLKLMNDRTELKTTSRVVAPVL